MTLRLVDEYLPAGEGAHMHTLCEWRIVITPPPAQGNDAELLTGEEREEECAAQAMDELQAVMDALSSCVAQA